MTTRADQGIRLKVMAIALGMLLSLGVLTRLQGAEPVLTTAPAHEVRFMAHKNKFYQLERSDSANGPWRSWGDPIKGAGETVTRLANVKPRTQPRFRAHELKNQWVLVWRDEFDGKVLDTTKWAKEENGYGGGNRENQFYSTNPKYCYVKAGQLNLALFRDPVTTSDGKRQPYSSARIRSLRRGDWKYGKFEIRAKVPGAQGVWPAVWMLPTDSKYGGWASSGEIDILESRGSQVGETVGTIHFGGKWPNNKHKGKAYKFPDKNASEAFHVYTVEWKKDEIRWSVDGVQYQVITKDQWFSGADKKSDTAPFDRPFHLIINLAVDGGFFNGTKQKAANVPDKAFPQLFQVDYVRVSQWAK
jgi:beta-glucanase (GH16 family)